MTHLLRRAAVVVLGGIAAAGMSACTTDDVGEASPSPTAVTVASPSPSTTASASPSPTVTPEDELLAQIPPEARVEDFPGAVNFAKFFLELYPTAMQTLDADLFSLLSAPQCEFCASVLSTRQELADAGQRREGGEIVFSESPASGGITDDGTYSVILEIETRPSQTLDASGEVVGSGQGGAGLAGFSLAYGDGHWTVLGVNLERRN